MSDKYIEIDNMVSSELQKQKKAKGLTYKAIGQLCGLPESKVKRVFHKPSSMRITEARTLDEVLELPLSLVVALTVPAASSEAVAKAYNELGYLRKLSITLQLFGSSKHHLK